MKIFIILPIAIILFLLSPLVTLAAPPAQSPALTQTIYLPLVGSEKQPPLQVATYWHFFASNQLFIFGEIINTGNEAVTPRPIEALFFDKDGTYLDGIPLSVPRNHLPPGEMACFGGPLDGPFFKPPDGWAYFVLEQPEFFPGDLPPAVTIISHQGMYNPVDKSYRVSGSVRNDQAADLHNVRMAVTVYDSLNQVTGCSAVHLNQTTLAAAEVGYFSMRFGSIYRDRGNIHRYRLQVD